MNTDSLLYKVLNWLDITVRSVPIYTRVLMLFVVLFGALVFGLAMAQLVVVFSV